MLIAKGARIGRALVTAAREGRTEVVKLLLHHGASLNAPPETGASAFGLAIEMGNVSLAQILYQAGATRTGYLRSIKGEGMAEFLDRAGLLNGILRDSGWLILAHAIKEEKSWLVDRILKMDLNFSGRHFPILAEAVRYTRQVNLIAALIDHGASCQVSDLEAAIKADTSDAIMHFLLAEYMRLAESDQGDSIHILPHQAAYYGSGRILRVVLKAADWKPEDLGAAITGAIQAGNYGVIQDLLDAGASFGNGHWIGSPLGAAVDKKQVWLVKMLLKAGANVADSQSCGGGTVLESAKHLATWSWSRSFWARGPILIQQPRKGKA